MPLLQMMQPQQQSGMDPQQMMRLIGMMAAAGGGAPGAGTPPPPSMEGMMPPSGMMPTPQGASMMSSPMGPPTQLQGLMNPPANNLGLAPQGSPVTPMASQIAMSPAYNRPAAPMPQQQWTDASIAAQEAALQAQDDALQAGSMPSKKPDYQKAAGLLGQMNNQMSSKTPPPEMQPLSRGQAAPMQAAASPLVNSGGGYREMLMKLAQGRYG